MQKKTGIIISVLLLAFVLRMYKINSPIADWHSWRQADTAAVTRNFIQQGFTPLVPRFDDISNIPSGRDNPEGYRMVEFPLYNILSYGTIGTIGRLGGSIEFWMRATSVFLSVGAAYLIFLIGQKYASYRVGVLAAVFFALLPYSVYYSRVILPEPALVFFSTGMIWFFSAWVRPFSKKKIEKRLSVNYLYVIALLFAVCSLLIKPIAGFLFLPLGYIWYTKKDFSLRSIALFVFFFVAVLFPLYLWRTWIQQFPEGIPAWRWLLNGNGIRFRPAFFRWMVWERLTKLILGYGGVVFLLAALVSVVKKMTTGHIFLAWWAAAISLYICVFATGNVQHDYYQVIAVPILSLWLGVGVDALYAAISRKTNALFAFATIVALASCMVWFSWKTVEGYYWINNQDMILAGKRADQILPEDAIVIAPLGGDTAFLYQVNRKGFPVGISIEEMIEKGATHYVNINMDDAEVDYIREAFAVIEETDRYIIASLVDGNRQ